VKRIIPFSLFLLVIPFLFLTCNLTEEGGGGDFIDQTLQGTIAGSSWTFAAGVAEISPFDETELAFDLYHIEAAGTPCDFGAFSATQIVILFSVPNEVGLYNLGLDQSVTIYDGTTNYIVTTGKLEILTIDTTTNMQVTGRLVAEYDSSYTVNGNFSVTYCNN